MNISKIFWGLRAIVYKARLKNIRFPSYIGKPIFIQNANRISIGKRCRIYPGMRAEVVDSDAKLIIGDNVSIGQNFHIVAYHDKIIIGNDVTISGNVFISNCDHSYQKVGVHILNQELIYRETIIGDGSFIGYGAVIQAGTKLGKQCIVGANAVVRGEFPSFSVIVGAPAKIVKEYNSEKRKWEKV